jgi:hypothetical protein
MSKTNSSSNAKRAPRLTAQRKLDLYLTTRPAEAPIDELVREYGVHLDDLRQIERIHPRRPNVRNWLKLTPMLWDDPRWYQQGASQSVWQLFTSLPSYQFYRPLAIWLNRQLVSPAGVVNAPLAHAIQIVAHLVAVLASVPALRALGVEKNHARLAALLFALSPFAYQAVAWQAPQQPLTLMWMLLAVLAARRFADRRQKHWLLISLLAYGTALLFQESAAPFMFVFFWLAWNRNPFPLRSQVAWPLLHLLLAAAYLLVWLNVPRAGGVTGQGFQPVVLAYLLQGVVFPVAALTAPIVREAPVVNLIGLYAGATLFLTLGLGKQALWRLSLLSLFWIGAGLLPIYAGLAWAYVETGSRLLYPASLGIALLWAGGLTPLWTARRWWGRVLAGALFAGVVALCLTQWQAFQKLYQRGTTHLARTVDVLSESPDAQLLFVNYPDRIEIYPPPYPLGVWGLTLAPVVQNLADYALACEGHSARDESLSAFLVGAAEREAWPYRVFMRGSDTPPAELFDAVQRADAVYLTDYVPGGELRLRAVGAVMPARANPLPPTATFGEAAQLIEGGIVCDNGPVLRLTWLGRAPLRAGDTIFVHLWQAGAFAGAADGDSLGGVLPLSAWQPGAQIVDLRPLHFPDLPPGTYEVRVGLYSQWDNERYPARSPTGAHFLDDEVPVGNVTLP